MIRNRESILSIMSTLSTSSQLSRRSRAGYTLIEIAFASFVVGVAFLALVGLGRLAVQGAVDAENDTRSALLAEDVFATLRGYSDTLCATGGPSAWAAFWVAFTDEASESAPTIPFQTAAGIPVGYTDIDSLDGSPPVPPVLAGDGTTTRLAVVNSAGGLYVTQWTTQFSITASATNALYMGEAEEYVTGAVSNVSLVTLTLHVWPNAYDRRERSRSFLTYLPYQGLHHGNVVAD